MRPRPVLLLAAALSFSLAGSRAHAQEAAPEADGGPSLTVYSSADPAGFDPQQFIAQNRDGGNPWWAYQVPGFGVVREIRNVSLAAGGTEARFTDVAQFIDPTTVSIADLTDPATSVVEQNFQFDLVSPQKLLEKYIDRDITVETAKDGQVVASVTGRVLSVNQGQVVLQTAQGLRFVSAQDPGIRLPSLPEGLITKPTLLWKLSAKTAGEHRMKTTYQTGGITWRSDYNVVLNADDTKADVSAWVTLLNVSGASYRNAKLKLVAGDVQRVQAPRPEYPRFGKMQESDAATAGFAEKAFFEYHLYTLPRPTDVLQNQVQQITLFPSAQGVAVEKVLVYFGAAEAQWWSFGEPNQDRDLSPSGNPKLDVYVRFRNSKDNRMGMPLPKGKVRVYKQDTDGSLEFVGEDLIDHTAKDESVLAKLGQSFDVVGERTQTDFDADTSRRTMTESFRIQLRNHKDTAQKVLVKEPLYRWTKWDVTANSDPFTKADARTVHFDVVVPPNGEKTVTYTVKYSW